MSSECWQVVASTVGHDAQLDKQEELEEQETSVSQIGKAEMPTLQIYTYNTN